MLAPDSVVNHHGKIENLDARIEDGGWRMENE